MAASASAHPTPSDLAEAAVFARYIKTISDQGQY
jgi:hypothetical protein